MQNATKVTQIFLTDFLSTACRIMDLKIKLSMNTVIDITKIECGHFHSFLYTCRHMA